MGGLSAATTSSAEVGVCPCRAGPPNQGSDGGASGAAHRHHSRKPSAACAPVRFLVRSKSARQGQTPTEPTPPTTKRQADDAAGICLKLVPAGGAFDFDLPDHMHNAGSQCDHTTLEAARGGRSGARTTQQRASERSYVARRGAQRNAGPRRADRQRQIEYPGALSEWLLLLRW